MQENEVDVWIADLDLLRNSFSDFQKLLSEQELVRKDQFATSELQMNFVLSHGILHTLLQSYLGIKNDEINIAYGVHGKPFLQHSTSLQFNLSHSKNLAIYGFTKNVAVGVDVEYMEEAALLDGTQDYLFSHPEKKVFDLLNPEEKKLAFFHTWTRKEAVRKAQGVGLLEPLDGVEMVITPKDPPKILKIDKDDPAEWSLFTLDVGNDFVGACAVKAPDFILGKCKIIKHFF